MITSVISNEVYTTSGMVRSTSFMKPEKTPYLFHEAFHGINFCIAELYLVKMLTWNSAYGLELGF